MIIFESIYNLLYFFLILIKLSKILFGLVDIVFFIYGYFMGKIIYGEKVIDQEIFVVIGVW